MKVTFEGLDPAVRKLQALPFPASPDDDGLADIVSDLSALTAKMLAAADRAGRGEQVWPDQVPDTGALIRQLNEMQSVGEDDVESFTQTVEYVEALDQIRRLLLP